MEEFFDVLNSNGEYKNEIASRNECHEKGLWHKAIALFIISEDNKNVLLQQRSSNKKVWPNMWDITSGGHVLKNELGYQAAIRETKEELGIYLDKKSLEFIGVTTSEVIKGSRIDRHFNEYYIVHQDIDLNNIVLQKEEVQDIKWFDKEDIIKRVTNNYDGLTDKIGCWEYLIKYFEIIENSGEK